MKKRSKAEEAAAVSAAFVLDGMSLAQLMLLHRWQKAAHPPLGGGGSTAGFESPLPAVVSSTDLFKRSSNAEDAEDAQAASLPLSRACDCSFFFSRLPLSSPVPDSTVDDGAPLTGSLSASVVGGSAMPAVARGKPPLASADAPLNNNGIDAPRSATAVPSSLSCWGRKVVDDDSDDGDGDDLALLLPKGSKPAKAASSVRREVFPSAPAAAAEASKPSNTLAALFTTICRTLVLALQGSDGGAPPEATVAAEVAGLVVDTLRYTAEALAIFTKGSRDASNSSGGASVPVVPWTQKYPAGPFRSSLYMKEFNRVTKWLRTWRIATTVGDDAPLPWDAPPVSIGAVAGSGDPSTGGSGGASPVDRQGSGAFDDDAFIFDDRGNRSSARIARKEAAKRAEEEDEERRRQQQRGYFSNDTSAVGCTSADGGAGSTSNIAVITGPCGVGKTAVTYVAAAAMGYRVVEINTSVKRCPKAVERIFSEATQSKQIRTMGKFTAAHEQLSKWKLEADEKARAAAAADAERKRLQEEALALDQQQQQADKAGKGPAGASASADPAKKPQALARAGVKRANGFSKEAVAKFFAPKRKPVADAPKEIVQVDDDVPALPPPPPLPVGPGPATAISSIAFEQEVSSASDCAPITPAAMPPSSKDKDSAFSRIQAGNNNGSSSNRKRPRDASSPISIEVDSPCVHAAAAGAAKGDAAAATASTATQQHRDTIEVRDDPSPSPPQAPQALLPLILVESADVMLADEQARPFYNAIRSLAAESRFPIIVTANSMTMQQAASFFGPGTPHAEMGRPSAIVLALEVLVIAAVERKLIVVSTAGDDGSTTAALGGVPALAVTASAEAQLHELAVAVVAFVQADVPRRALDARACLLDAQVYFREPSAAQRPPASIVAATPGDTVEPPPPNHTLLQARPVAALRARLAAAAALRRDARQPLPLDLQCSSDDGDNGSGPDDTDGATPAAATAMRQAFQTSAAATSDAAAEHHNQQDAALDANRSSSSSSSSSLRSALCQRLAQDFPVPHRYKGHFARARAMAPPTALVDFASSPWMKLKTR